MNDYSKWDKLQDSDEEPEPSRPEPEREELEQFRADQELVEQWLRKQVVQLNKAEGVQREQGGMRPPEPPAWQPPELNMQRELAPYRKPSKEELKTLSMLIVLSHFDDGKTNLDRHPQMLDVVRHNRWLEEDPGTLELLCRVHSQAMRKGSGGGPGGAGPSGGAVVEVSPEEHRMRHMCLSGINTLAGPKKAGCAGGLLELVTLICTPGTDSARELRKKWQMKEFAKDAIFDSLFPDLRKYGEEGPKDSGMKEVWIVLGVFLLFVIVTLLFIFGQSTMPIYSRPSSAVPSPPPGWRDPSEI
mmetsp:Transcript_78283/g.207762  ORF Transcript_78283/g.207762 Transcript_78283/m.207762 type:complete len:301 (-) Transcript_78283:51-953(-)